MQNPRRAGDSWRQLLTLALCCHDDRELAQLRRPPRVGWSEPPNILGWILDKQKDVSGTTGGTSVKSGE